MVNSLVSKRIADIFLYSLIILIRIPLAIVQKRLAIQCAPEPVYRLRGFIRQSSSRGKFRVRGIQLQGDTQILALSAFLFASLLVSYPSTNQNRLS
jgi:hypothetical protein